MGIEITDKDMGWNKLIKSFKVAEKEAGVSVGFLRSSGVYENSNVTVTQVAAVHEFGSSDGRIPERSFMRSSIDANKGKLEKVISKLAGQVSDGVMPQKKALGIIGQMVQDLMKGKILAGLSPPLAPSTVARKGSSKPLIDTGQLINSIDWEITEGKK